MPDYFAGYEIVAQTKNFLITCDSAPEARVRAQNVAGVCEDDLAKLNDLFSTNFETGVTSDHTVWVNALNNAPAAPLKGWNYGYETGESSQIVLQRAFTPPPAAASTARSASRNTTELCGRRHRVSPLCLRRGAG